MKKSLLLLLALPTGAFANNFYFYGTTFDAWNGIVAGQPLGGQQGWYDHSGSGYTGVVTVHSGPMQHVVWDRAGQTADTLSAARAVDVTMEPDFYAWTRMNAYFKRTNGSVNSDFWGISLFSEGSLIAELGIDATNNVVLNTYAGSFQTGFIAPNGEFAGTIQIDPFQEGELSVSVWGNNGSFRMPYNGPMLVSESVFVNRSATALANDSVIFDEFRVHVAPEPATLLACAVGVAGVLRRRTRSSRVGQR